MAYNLRVPFKLGQKVYRVYHTGGMGTRSAHLTAGWIVEGYKYTEDEPLGVMCYRDQGDIRRHEYFNAKELFATEEEAISYCEGE